MATKIRDVIKLIREDGWYLARQKGSHRHYKHLSKVGLVTIAGQNSQDLHPRTLNSILKQAGLSEARMRFIVVIEEGENNYSAYLPHLPGCVAAADTLDEVKELISEAAIQHIELMEEEGLPVVPPKVPQLVLDVTPIHDLQAATHSSSRRTYVGKLLTV